MQKKLQLSFLISLFIMGLLVLEGPLYAQAGNPDSANPTTNPTIAPEKEKPTDSPQEEHNTEDLEKLLKKYNTDAEKVIEDSSKLHNAQEGETKIEVNEKELEKMPATAVEVAMKEDKGEKTPTNSAPPTGLSASVRVALEPLQTLSEKELLKRLDEATKQSIMRPYMDEFPNITLFTVRLVKDKESIPSMVKIVENKDRLIQFISLMICTMFLGFGLKRVMHKEGRTFLRATFYFFVRVYIMFAIRIGVIYYFFSEEFTPAAKVFKQTFMS
jgi:hypothetical protein